jgi:ornithine decarboxylase
MSLAGQLAEPARAVGFGPSPRVEAFLDGGRRETPFVVVDLEVVAARYEHLVEALPQTTVFYAVKANPAREVLELLVDLGSSFDVASPGEIDRCLALGADPSSLSYGNTIKKRRAIEYAFERGIRRFAVDSAEELAKVIDVAPGSTVCCRMLCDGAGGLSFHVGSQQRDPEAWDRALAVVGEQYARLRDQGVEPSVLNLGGGFPGRYVEPVGGIPGYGEAIDRALARHLGPDVPDLVIAEPGRYLVADAGVLQSEVVLVARKARTDARRWVYLDVGLFGGLAETMDEAIRYPIRTPHDGSETGPVVLAGPTCDSADILYDVADYRLPLALTAGDRVELLSTGAYTTTYSSVWFNGLAPLQAHYLPAR